MFYVIRFSIALVNPQKANQVLGMHQFFQGQSLPLAELFAGGDDVVTVAMDDKDHRELMVEAYVCNDCYLQPITLPLLAEKVQANDEAGGA
jgi:hypothetical protein